MLKYKTIYAVDFSRRITKIYILMLSNIQLNTRYYVPKSKPHLFNRKCIHRLHLDKYYELAILVGICGCFFLN